MTRRRITAADRARAVLAALRRQRRSVRITEGQAKAIREGRAYGPKVDR